MQRDHLEVVAHLLDVAGNGEDEEYWGQRFREHLAVSMKKHGENLKGNQTSNGPLRGDARQAEVLRARLELHKVVAERLEARTSAIDPSLSEGYALLHETNEPLVEEALAMAITLASTLSAPSAAPKQDPPQSAAITCQQLLALIDEVYAAKGAQTNQLKTEPHKSRGGSVGRGHPGTLEWLLYEQLAASSASEQALEAKALAVFRAVKEFAPIRCEVEVFGKILQSQLPESCASALEEQKFTIRRLLKNQAGEGPVGAMKWKSWARDGVPYQTCKHIVQMLYVDLDSNEILQRLQSILVGDKVKMMDFQQLLLRYQMQLTELFLGDLIQNFNKVDFKQDGMLDQNALLQLAALMGALPDEDDPQEELDSLQASLMSTTSATFSDCAAIFSEVMVKRWEGS